MSESFFIDVISGTRKSLSASLLRGLLWCGTPLYAGVTVLRNWLFDVGLKSIHQVDVPVISIGNITTGGTGKTPTVAWLVNHLSERGHSPGIVSRGYRSLDGNENDEKRLLDQMFANIPHQQHRKRSEAAQAVVNQGCNVIVLDDGFQHRRLHRDLEIVLIDALNPFGFGHLLPRGLLREQLFGLRRADLILLTRCDLVGTAAIQQIKEQIQLHTTAEICETEFRSTRLVNSSGDILPIKYASEHRISAFCGIGNPSGFRRTLASIGAPVSEDRFRAFPDHHHYTNAEFEQLAFWANAQHAELIVVTRKDLVKINRPKLRQIPVWAIDIELAFRDSNETLARMIDALLDLS